MDPDFTLYYWIESNGLTRDVFIWRSGYIHIILLLPLLGNTELYSISYKNYCGCWFQLIILLLVKDKTRMSSGFHYMLTTPQFHPTNDVPHFHLWKFIHLKLLTDLQISTHSLNIAERYNTPWVHVLHVCGLPWWQLHHRKFLHQRTTQDYTVLQYQYKLFCLV